MKPKSPIATIPATTLARVSGQILRRVAVDGEHIQVEKDGFPVAVLIPMSDYQQLVASTRVPKSPLPQD